MAVRGINRLSADSIEDVEDIRTWARDQEIRLEQIGDTLAELRDVGEAQHKRIGRNLRLFLIGTTFSGAVLAIVVLLSGTIQIIKVLF